MGVGFLSLTAAGLDLDGCQPGDRLDLEPEEPRSVLRRVSQDLSRVAGDQSDRAGHRDGPARGRLVRLGLMSPRSAPRIAWITLGVLVVMNLVGRNMGEVARLWMLFLPPLLTAAGVGTGRLAGWACVSGDFTPP